MFDIIIIGGGPAGTTAGTLLQRKGYKTCIIDKAVFPREKLCAGVLTVKSVECIKNVFKDLDFSKLQLREVHDIEFIYNDKSLGKHTIKHPFRVANRCIMDNHLLEYYKSVGGTVFEGQNNYKLNYKENRIVLDDGTVLSYKLLIGADGIHSKVRKFVDKPFETAFFCYETYIPNADNEEAIKIYFTKKTKGYYWRIPGINRIAIGLAIAYEKDDIYKLNNYKDFFIQQGVEDIQNVKGYFYSYGDYVIQPVRNNVLLVGDAAGLIDAVTGEGVYFALESGRQAALAISSFDITDSPKNIGIDYCKRLEPIHKKINEQKLCNKLVYAPFVKEMGMKLIKDHPNGVKRILENVVSSYNGGYGNR